MAPVGPALSHFEWAAVILCGSRSYRGRSQCPRCRSLAEIVGSNPAGGMDVCHLYSVCVLSGRGLCVGLITRPEESYRVRCVSECDREASTGRRSWPTRGLLRLWGRGGNRSYCNRRSDCAAGWVPLGSRFASRQGQHIFLFSKTSKQALMLVQSPVQWIPGALSQGVKRPGRESSHALPCSIEVKVWQYT
jgi:hypothetical protein